MKKNYIIPIFIPHLGCPNDCIFCNQKKIAKDYDAQKEENIKNDIEKYLALYEGKKDIELAFYGGSFTAFDYPLMLSYLKLANTYIERGLIDSIRISTRPDAISEEILDELEKYKVKIIELGAQSMNDEVLAALKRGHKALDTIRSAKMIKDRGFTLGLQMMTGLYKSTKDMDVATAEAIAELEPDFVRIYPTLVIKDTELVGKLEDGSYKPLDVDEAVDTLKSIVIIFEAKDIEIIRIGLQTTDNIQLGKDVVAGPFHPAIRSLTYEAIYLDIIEEFIEINKITNDFTIISSKKVASFLSGSNKSNRKKIYNKYKINYEIKGIFYEDDRLMFYDGSPQSYSFKELIKNKYERGKYFAFK